MKVSLSDAGKRFNREWIFRHLTYTLTSGNAYAIVGANGSGKSTFLQVISGSMEANEGQCEWSENETAISTETIYKDISICAPYLELIEEMTLKEFFQFHQQFKPFLPGISIDEIIAEITLEKAADKQIRYYSSGMKQRAKLAQAILCNTKILLLDEPCTNLDKTGIALYHQLIEKYAKEKLIIVSSNDEVEYSFCKEKIMISDYKQ